MITEAQIDWAIKVLENPVEVPFTKEVARKMVDAYVKQENQTLRWLDDCYGCCRNHAAGPANSA